MTWTRLSDNYDGTTVNLSDAAFRTDVQGLIWCNRNLTDGVLTQRAVRLVSVTDAAVEELVDAGMWTPTADGYQLDWSEQETAEAVRKRRDHTAARNREYRQRKDAHAGGDHALCDPRFCPDASSDKSRDASRTPSVTLSRPVPSPRRGRGPRSAANKAVASDPVTIGACGHPMIDATHCERGCHASLVSPTIEEAR
ncbi:hypothetical protein [Microbacterium sp. NPDC087589]|uniref:hypothetical protein n=1 Tax=Microbacterium sp. NPDC087589 TaxID=3364191 RepID=UPI00380638ED